MAIIWAEGFDAYANANDLTKVYQRQSGATGIDTTGGRLGGPALYGNDESAYIDYQFLALGDQVDQNDVAFGFWYKAAAIPTATTLFFVIWNKDYEGSEPDFDVENWGAYIDALGHVEVDRWQSNDGLRDTYVNVCDNEWHWLEFRFKGDNAGTGGYLQVYIDGMNCTTVEILNGDTNEFGADTGQLAIRLYANTGSFNAEGWIDSVIMYDDRTLETGDITPAADFPLGPVRVERLLANGAGTTTQLTASAGLNYQCVDETLIDYAGDYVSSSTSGHTDTYAFDNLSGSAINTIHGAVMRMWAKNGGAGGTIQGRLVTYSGATEDLGPNTDLYYAYVPGLQYCFPRDPNTAAAWTETNLNAAEFGFEVV